MGEEKKAMFERIQELKRLRNAVVLAHNYQLDEVQDVADFVGDSFELSRIAAQSSADVIVFCGVHFMAEVAAILAPDRIVLLPEIQAGCPLADMVTLEALLEKKKQYPAAMVVTYINSPAVVKAVSDICVTSSNAVSVVNSLDTDEVLFVPDMNLGSFVAGQTDKRIILWDGYCVTHHRVRLADVAAARRSHPDAVIVVHPECRPEVVKSADYVFSTGGMIKFARETSYEKIIVGTEMGLIYRLQKENPHKQFYLLSQGLICPNMKFTDLEKVSKALETMQPQISVPLPIRDLARRPLERMFTAV
ncbi:MAG: quinolinate synthase NadA [Dethiobacter sp.]|jgi:quinolinate synthase|nr:MAG: quinolinate synthase NadA [Dethiobacter sp.]